MSLCVEIVSHTRIKIEENGMKAIFLNPTREACEKGHIDKCLVTEGIRADYYLSNSSKTIMIELKGCDINHACAQLFKAAEHPKIKPKLKKSLGFLIICSRVPSSSTSSQIAEQKARKKYKAKFKVYCRMREISFDDF